MKFKVGDVVQLKGTSKNNATDVKLDRLCGSRGS